MKSETVSQYMFHHKTLNKSFTPLPVIYQPILNSKMSTSKIKEKIIELKKELNKRLIELNELKIVMLKLESEKEMNKTILNKAITESKTTEKPIELKATASQKDMTISTESYSKLKEANTISSLKHKVALAQKQIKQKDDEIEELKTDSKVVKLIEKNNQLLEVINQTTIVSQQIDNLRVAALEKETKARDEVSKRDQYKAKVSTIKSELEMLKEKYKNTNQENALLNQKMGIYLERANNVKFQYNTSKQSERELDNEIRFYEEQFATEERLVQDRDKNNAELKRYSKEIQQLKEEIRKKNSEIKSLEIDNIDCVSIIEREEANHKKLKAAENSQIEAMKKEIFQRKKDIQALKEENEELIIETNILLAKLTNKAENVVNKGCEICSSVSEFTVIQIVPKTKPESKPLIYIDLPKAQKTSRNGLMDTLVSCPNLNKPRLSFDINGNIIRIEKTTPNIIRKPKRISSGNGVLLSQKIITQQQGKWINDLS